MRASHGSKHASAVGDEGDGGAAAATEDDGAAFASQFNPLVALQSLMVAEMASTKQRVRAAQQLEIYFRQLAPTPGLFLSYEPYLPVVTEIMITPAKGTHELQGSVLAMLEALSSHNPLGFSDWIASHTQLGSEPWFVQWSYTILLEAEKRVPHTNDKEFQPMVVWDESSVEFHEFDGAFARIMQMWRTLLDHTGEEALVDQLVKCLHSLLLRERGDAAQQWQTLLFRKLQTHFVDIADVLIGWTMNTGSASPLREDIVSLLDLMGQLWADNSVFSLQLLNSFADEIVNLCELWGEHELGDDDRLSTLLVCFMMVAQCVPDLALHLDNGLDSPFARVLQRVVLSREPEYSLFCVTKCAEYIASLSESGCGNFHRFSVLAVRFLLYNGSVLAQRHDSELEKIGLIVEKAQHLATANFWHAVDSPNARVDAIGVMEDDIPVRVAKKGHQPKRMKVLECLFLLKCTNGVKLMTRLCLQLVQVGGTGALKVLCSSTLGKTNGRSTEAGISYFVFAATCFILASRNRGLLRFTREGDVANATAIMESLVSKLEQTRHDHRQRKLAPRQISLILKMACTFQAACGRGDIGTVVSGASLFVLDTSTRMLPSDEAVIQDPRFVVEVLKALGAMLSQAHLAPVIPQPSLQTILKQASKLAHSSSVKVREESVKVLKILSSRHGDPAFASDAFRVSLDLVLDVSTGIQREVVLGVLGNVSTNALLTRDQEGIPRHVSQQLHSTFGAADFESIMRLLGRHGSKESDWKQTCSILRDRVRGKGGLSMCTSDSNSDLLLSVVRQAAAWCVQNRLRTHFGGPSQTFSSIERLLMEYSIGEHESSPASSPAQLPTNRGESREPCQRGERADLSSALPSTLLCGLSKWMMLEFASALEVCILHAIDGADIEQDNPESEANKTALFFRTNKAVCDDWLNRIRPLLLEMSSIASSFELCRHHSHAMLLTCSSKLNRILASSGKRAVIEVYKDLKFAEKEVDIALYSLCRSYCDAKDVDSVVGFHKWGELMSSKLCSWYGENRGSIYMEEENWRVPLFRWLEAVRYEAAMQYEDAAAEYEAILQPVLDAARDPSAAGEVYVANYFEAPMTFLRLSPSVLMGCFKQCAKCYAAVRSWTKLREFVAEFLEITQCLEDRDRPIEGMQQILQCRDVWRAEIDQICSLEAHECEEIDGRTAGGATPDGEFTKRAALSLHHWGILDAADQQYADSLASISSDRFRMGLLRNALLPLALQPSPWNGCAGESVGKRVEECLLKICRLALAEHSRTSFTTTLVPSSVSLGFCGTNLNPAVHDASTWSHHFYLSRGPATPTSSGLPNTEKADQDCLYLTAVAKLARKQHNFRLARRLLTDAEKVCGSTKISSSFVNYEKARLLDTLGMEDEGRQFLEAQCETSLMVVGLEGSREGGDAVRPLLRLASTVEKSEGAELLSSTTTDLLSCLASTEANAIEQPQSELAQLDSSCSAQNVAVRSCLEAATQMSPGSAKAWFHYSNWCYAQSKQEVARIVEQNGYIHLEPSDELEMTTLLDELEIAEPDRDHVVRAFCHFMENGELISHRADNFRRLCMSQAPSKADPRAVDRLVQLQTVCHSRVLQFHSLAARGYSKYLAVLLDDANTAAAKQKIIMVTLRLLGLLTSYGAEEEVLSALEDTFTHGPVVPWSYIAPQLFARAHHPVTTVSSLIFLILKRLARHSPHIVVYPAIVDSLESRSTCLTPERERGTSSNTFAGVLQELQNVSLGQVDGVRLLVSELRRISILWDEAWISTLMKLSSDVARRTSTLEKEAARVEKNASLSVSEKNELAHRKFVAIMKPILLSIERLWNETCGNASEQQAVSPHERYFLKEYGEAICEAMAKFRECCNLETAVDVVPGAKRSQTLWHPFAEILKSLLGSAGRRDHLPLRDISPAMASISSQLALTNIPGALSGKSSGRMEPITIHRVHSSVAVLRTKTKPKCLEFVGSDGKTYKYLLKAREDLRLDERIMQFLKVANEFLSADNAAACRDLSAQNYSVIPLSRDAGLIQMVPNVVPLFQVFTSRSESPPNNTRAPQMSPPSKTSGSAVAAPSQQQHQPPPPTAQFYAKLKQHGITDVSPNQRAQWPVAVLKKVYQDLVAQRPRNVLQQEVMLRSDDLRENWSKNARLSRSLAVMSVLGYIIGLGDRHLDNILLCTKSGDIVHIDHNVCFDKGRKLKVPEIVPFRLTPMLQDALGLTGVEGRFRVAFETTLRVVRADNAREALLTLLEAFVYSPLVDWIIEESRRGRSGDLKARLEVNVNLSLFLSRAEERRQDTITFGRQYEALVDGIAGIVEASSTPFEHLLRERSALLAVRNEEQALSKELSKLDEELSERLRVQQTTRVTAEAAKACAEEVGAKLKIFGNECLGKHRQIESWRQKSIGFSKSQKSWDAVVQAVRSASFQAVYGAFCDVVKQSPLATHSKQLLAALESKCQAADMDVDRLRAKADELVANLRPYLAAYSHRREGLDAYLSSVLGTTTNDVYFAWWSRCAKGLRELGNVDSDGAKEEASTKLDPKFPLGPPVPESIAESSWVVSQVDRLRREGRLSADDECTINVSEKEQAKLKLFSEADQQIQRLGDTLSTLKLSNAQGQRLMKLAGACWIVAALDKLDKTDISSEDFAEDNTPTTLLMCHPVFQTVVAVSKASSTLLELVSTHKGSMKRLRAADLLEDGPDRQQDLKEDAADAGGNLAHFVGILHEVEMFAVAVQEELFFDLHGIRARKSDHEEALRLLEAKAATAEGAEEVMKLVSGRSGTISCSVDAAPQDPLARCPAIHTVVSAAVSVVDKLAACVEALQQTEVLGEAEATRTKNSSTLSWLRLALDIVSLFIEEDADEKESSAKKQAATLWASHVDDFLSSCLVKLLRSLLSSVISSEWKFAFSGSTNASDAAAAGDGSVTELKSLSERWSDFFSSEIPDILPSTVVGLPIGTSEVHARDLSTQLITLTELCELWWSQKWRLTQSQLRCKRIASLQLHHEQCLQYAAWVSTEPQHAVESSAPAPQLTRVQLLGFLSSQVPSLNALLADQVTIETSVLEVAQQMEYIASELSASHVGQHTPDGSLHDLVQACYSKMATLFEYGRSLADLVQGISVIETSTGEPFPEAGNVELEVDVVGKQLLQTAAEARHDLQASKKAMLEHDVAVRVIQDEMEHKKAQHDALSQAYRAQEQDLRGFCSENKAEIFRVSREVYEQATRMLFLFKAFDKFKTSSKPKATPAGSSATSSSAQEQQQQQQQEQQSKSGSSSASDRFTPVVAAGYSFMENERLVKILLRSIRSVKHLSVLESILEKHDQLCSRLRETVAGIDQGLRTFVERVDPLLRDSNSSQKVVDDSSSLPSPFLALAQGTASKTASVNASASSISSHSPTDSFSSSGMDHAPSERGSPIHVLFCALLDLMESLRLVRIEDAGAEEGREVVVAGGTPVLAPLLETGRELVRGCVKLFFEATEMADRLSSTEEQTCRAEDAAAALPDSVDDVVEDTRGSSDNAAPHGPLASGSSGTALAVSSSSGSSGDISTATSAATPVEEKNQYGVQVLRRIEEKLSGTVTELAKGPPVLTVEQQASWLIDEATKPDNLCVMYEGWTPWI